MNLYYDLHIHTLLSPCADKDMTPNNIVNMAILKGLDIIAITDHNTAKNCGAVISVGQEKGLLVIPGIELQTSEDIHILCFFSSLNKALQFENEVLKNKPIVKNREDIFGEQLLANERDEIVGKTDELLLLSSGLSLEQALKEVKRYGGACVPSHIDRQANSLLYILGEINLDFDFKYIEISKAGEKDGCILTNSNIRDKFNIMYNSDAHYLWDISERQHFFDLKERSAECLINYINSK